MEHKNILRLLLAFCMILWASIGLFTRSIALDSFELAFFRAFLSLPFLFFFLKLNKKDNKRLPLKTIIYYLFTGALIGIAWSLLFQGYKYTTLSTAVLIYNMCPVYVIILAPFFLKEKITFSRIITILGCFFGLYLLIKNNLNLTNSINQGIIWAFGAGFLYSIIVILNRKINFKNKNSNIILVTLIQLLGSSLILLPYQIINKSFTKMIHLSINNLILLFILSLIHTAIAYIIYFSTYKKLEAIEIVSYSYLEPLFTIFFGIFFFQEKLFVTQIIGGLFILGFTLWGELYNLKDKDKKILIKERT